MIYRAFVALFLFLLCSCGNLKEVQVTRIKGLNVSRISMEGIDAALLLNIKNPNGFGFSIRKSEFDVNYSGIHIGRAKLGKRVRIKANTEETYRFELTTDFKNVNVVDVMKLLNGASFKNTIEVKGDLNAGSWFIRRKIPVQVTEQLRLQ